MNFNFSIILTFMMLASLNIGLCQTVDDSTKIKYDNFVAEKKLKAKDKFTYSQFAIALRYKDTLGLNSLQTDRMYLEIQNLKQIKNQHYALHKESKDTRSLESEIMTQILTESQYNLLLRIKNHSKAKAMSESDWKEMDLRQMATVYSQSQSLDELYEYYVIRQSIYDKYRHDPIVQQAEARAHFNNRPACLKALAKLRRSSNDNFGKNFNGN